MRLSLAIFFAFFLVGTALGSNYERPNDLADRYTSIFNQLDADGDNHLTQEEAAAAGLTAESFRRLDKNGDGQLSLDEFVTLANDAEALTSDTGSGSSSDADLLQQGG